MRIIQSRSESRRSLALQRLNDRNVMGQLQLNDVKDFMWQADAFTMDSVAAFVNSASLLATKASLNGPCFAMKAIYCKAGALTSNEGTFGALQCLSVDVMAGSARLFASE